LGVTALAVFGRLKPLLRTFPRLCGLGLVLILAACATPPSVPTATLSLPPTATLTSTPTATPTLTPTPTPLPPLQLSLHLPEVASALPPARLEVSLAAPPGVVPSAIVAATVFEPGTVLYGTYELLSLGGERYVSTTPLQLPLEPRSGDWLVVVDVRSDLPVVGHHAGLFRAAPLPYRVLSETLPSGVMLRVPEIFVEVERQGDAWAGNGVWRSCERDTMVLCPGVGEVGLWWAPGPTEPLTSNTALVMLEATYPAERPPALLATEEAQWQGRPAFRFTEEWPGYMGGPAETWVIQGDDRWLYVLRMRAVGEDAIPTLVREVGETFAFLE